MFFFVWLIFIVLPADFTFHLKLLLVVNGFKMTINCSGYSINVNYLSVAEPSHRLNLFYLANDVIQNCKRKNAIVYRSTFAEVLPEAALLVK